MDIGTVGGLILGFASMILAVYLETVGIVGHGYLNIPGIFLIFGGTTAAVMVSFSIKELSNCINWMRIITFNKPENRKEIVEMMVSFSQKARREGLLALEADIENIKDAFFRKGMQLVVDGVDPDLVKEILEADIAQMEARHKIGNEFFTAAGGYSPTMGMIGAIVGLAGALGKMGHGDVMHVVHGLAVAFIASFYGIAFANIVLLPIAGKLKYLSDEEVVVKEMILTGILSIQAGDNPRIVEEKLKSFFAPKEYATKEK